MTQERQLLNKLYELLFDAFPDMECPDGVSEDTWNGIVRALGFAGRIFDTN